jgi:small subunit ribosomal protein S1
MVDQQGRATDERSTPPEQDNPMQELLDAQDFAFKAIKRGDTVSGTIIRLEANEILVDIGSKTEGVINLREMEGNPGEAVADLKIGDEVQAVVVSPEDRNGHVVLALSRSHTDRDWRDAEQLFESQDVFEGVVAGHNKGGLIVKIGKVRGFVPASQLVSGRSSRSEGGEGGSESRDNPWAALTGQKLQLKVIEIDRQRNRLILSERAAVRDWRKQQKEKLLSELREGDIREGKVISLADFGAFVDLGGADGLVHLSELSWKRVNHPREVLKVGQKVRAQVINIDGERKRIGLSLKRLESDPWSSIEQRYHIDQLVEGTITKLAKFGAFARIKGDEEIEGLIHVSELSEGHVGHPKEVVHEGQLVTLRIIRIDPQERRLGLSLKRVAKGEYADADWQHEMEAAEREEAEAALSELSQGIPIEPAPEDAPQDTPAEYTSEETPVEEDGSVPSG